MKRKTFTKKILAVALSLIMVLGLMPMTVFADGTYTFTPTTQSGNNTSTIQYSMTDENAGDFTLTQKNQRIELMLVLDEGWYFEKWDTYFDGYEDVAILKDPKIEGVNPKPDNGDYTFFNQGGDNPIYDEEGPSNNSYYSGTRVENWAKDIYVRIHTPYYGRHTITAVLKPILTVIADDGIDYRITTNSPSYRYLEENQVAVKYGDNATVTYSVDNKYVVTSVSANYNTNYSENGTVVTVNSIKKPATVTIRTRLKQHNVVFNANGGEGTMSAQVFEHSVAQTLTENNFRKTGYTFAGWNTKADGTGTAYTDKQSVTFIPVNDGDSITLYAQWTACTNHQWEDGECAECGAACSHSGGTATCTEKAKCTECGTSYGELADHTYGDATCEAPATCSECRATTGDALGHKDDNTDHTCDRGCGKTDMGIHGDTNLDHICDYDCAVAIGTCEDADKDHDCDYGCDKYFGTHKDADKDHACDYGCAVTIGTCEDADKDHVCDYGCDKVYGTHEDTDTDHACDYGCSVTIGTCEDANKDHDCDYGCDKVYGTHAAASAKHTCDYCGNAVTTCTDFAEVVKPQALKSAADCTNPAVYYKSCTVCGANGPGTFTSGEAKGHTYDEGVVTTKPGCETEGIKTFTCTCGHSYTDPVSATGHTYTTAVTAPSCTEKGYTTYTCACSDSYVGDEVAATGHSFTEYKANGDATCTADGTKTAKCDNCETTDTAADIGGKKAHTYEKGKCTICEAVDPDYVPETDSPQTGDNSNMDLWIALLFISGGATITLTIYDRKKRAAQK